VSPCAAQCKPVCRSCFSLVPRPSLVATGNPHAGPPNSHAQANPSVICSPASGRLQAASVSEEVFTTSSRPTTRRAFQIQLRAAFGEEFSRACTAVMHRQPRTALPPSGPSITAPWRSEVPSAEVHTGILRMATGRSQPKPQSNRPPYASELCMNIAPASGAFCDLDDIVRRFLRKSSTPLQRRSAVAWTDAHG